MDKKIKNISKEQALKDYEDLCNLKCSEINPNSHIGNKALDYYFFKYRLKTKSIKGISFYEFVKKNIYKKAKSFIKLYNYNIKKNLNHYEALYGVFRLYFGSINQFKPIIAKKLYCIYKPKTILDFSCGWGGRLLAAMSLDINYIGFDTNYNLRGAYNNLIKDFPTKSNIEIYFEDSSKVDFSKFDYDFVFTSPPYFSNNNILERYENMPNYKDKDEFLLNFLFPVIENVLKHLKNDGIMALNVNKEMYDELKKVIGKATSKRILNISSRNTINYKEYIYIWEKQYK